MKHQDSSFGVSRRRAAIAPSIALAALLVLSACGGAGEPSPSPTPSASVVPSPSSVAPELSPSPSLSSSPVASASQLEATSLLDVNGRWCPTTPADWGYSCYVIDLPELRLVGDDDPNHISYVYPPGRADEDRRAFTDEDYAYVPDYGDCWSLAGDGYLAMRGAGLIYCPAGAKAGEAWIDDPVDSGIFASESNLQDYTGQDRLYMTQSKTPYPDIRTPE